MSESLAQQAKREEIIKKCQEKYPDYGGEELYTQTQVRAAMEEYAKLGEYVQEQLEKEVERLKGLIKEGFVLLGREWDKTPERIESDWQKFKIEHNL